MVLVVSKNHIRHSTGNAIEWKCLAHQNQRPPKSLGKDKKARDICSKGYSVAKDGFAVNVKWKIEETEQGQNKTTEVVGLEEYANDVEEKDNRWRQNKDQHKDPPVLLPWSVRIFFQQISIRFAWKSEHLWRWIDSPIAMKWPQSETIINNDQVNKLSAAFPPQCARSFLIYVSMWNMGGCTPLWSPLCRTQYIWIDSVCCTNPCPTPPFHGGALLSL